MAFREHFRTWQEVIILKKSAKRMQPEVSSFSVGQKQDSLINEV